MAVKKGNGKRTFNEEIRIKKKPLKNQKSGIKRAEG